MAKLYYRYGVMGSGKSAAISIVAHNYRTVGQKAYVIKPSVDTKVAAVVSSRIDALSIPADLVCGADDDLYAMIGQLDHRPGAVIVDESQWLTVDQVDQLFMIAVRLDIPVLCYGLRTDYRGQLWNSAGRLFALAHDLQELKMVCRCGRKATFSMLTADPAGAQHNDQGSPILIGADEAYVAVCEKHFLELASYNHSLSHAQEACAA